MDISGKVVSGLGKGMLFLSMKHYQEKIDAALGFVPFPGTLNVHLEEGDKQLFSDFEGVTVEGFEVGSKKFGSVTLHCCKVEGVECAVLIPERDGHGARTIEIVAPRNLREELDLGDGSVVELEITDWRKEKHGK